MLRQAKVEDIFRDLEKVKPKHRLENIDLDGLLGITETIKIKPGLFALCGLNGVGKTTILTAIKDLFGATISDFEKKKIAEKSITGVFRNGANQISVSNSDGERVVDKLETLNLEVIDYHKIVSINSFFEQSNLEEYVEQYDDNVFGKGEIEALSYLIGKTYDEVTLRELESDDDEFIPYFKVRCDSLEYDSTMMGTGEHFIFYIFWILKNISQDSILLIEEPEVFISVFSQEKLVNYIVHKINADRLSVILVTHSPHILRNINVDRITLIESYLNGVDLVQETNKENLLKDLGFNLDKKGILLFEDRLALEFFKSLCKVKIQNIPKYFYLDKVNGYSNITSIISTPKLQMHYKIMGVYDGDMRQTAHIPEDSLNWEYTYLPGENNLEKDFYCLVRENLEELYTELNVSERSLRRTLSKLEGLEYHDWFNKLPQELNLSYEVIVDGFSKIWLNQHSSEVDEFIREINEKLDCY